MSNVSHKMVSFDVVVIGGGAAGALAAIKAKQAGARVALITKESALVGGATIMAGGGTSVVMTREDSPEAFYDDILRSGQYINNRKLVRMVASHSMQALYALENCDFLLDRNDLKHNGSTSVHTFKRGEGHSYPRAYLDRREALGFCHGISKSILRHQIDLFTESIAVKLLKDPENHICGVIVYRLIEGDFVFFHCKAIVLATGGLGAIYEETTNSTVLSGTGFGLAYEIGAELLDMEMVQFMPLALPYPRIRRGKIIGMCSLLGPAVELYNGLGERYMGKYDPERLEFTTRDIGARANYTEIKEGRGTKNNTIVVDNRNFDPDILKRWQTTNPFRYRQCCQSFGPRGGNWEEVFEAIPSQHFFMGGVRINENLETNIPGLFAVGEVTGGIHGANRLSGVAFAEIFSLGPIAGINAAAYAATHQFSQWNHTATMAVLDQIETSLHRHGDGVRPFEFIQSVQRVMSNKLGPVRTGSELDEAISELRTLQQEVDRNMTVMKGNTQYNRERMEALEIPLMLETALMVAISAKMRTESRGSHYRTDYPNSDELWVKNITIRRGKNGQAVINTSPVVMEDEA